MWTSIDETFHSMRQCVANVIVGKFNVEWPGDPDLMCSIVLLKVNNATVANFFDK